MTSVNSLASFGFLLSDDEACPPLGQGFDLIAGDFLSFAGTDANPPTLRPVTLTAGDSHVAMTYDTASYSQAVQAQLDVPGSGWGGSVGEDNSIRRTVHRLPISITEPDLALFSI